MAVAVAIVITIFTAVVVVIVTVVVAQASRMPDHPPAAPDRKVGQEVAAGLPVAHLQRGERSLEDARTRLSLIGFI